MLTDYILIQLNGQPFNCRPRLSLKDIVSYLDFELDFVIIEYNSEIIQNSSLDDIRLASGDKVEVLTIVGGG